MSLAVAAAVEMSVAVSAQVLLATPQIAQWMGFVSFAGRTP
jgi:hypothetical protein